MTPHKMPNTDVPGTVREPDIYYDDLPILDLVSDNVNKV